MLLHQLLLETAERRPDATAYHWVDRDRSLTFAGAVDAMERMAGALADLGVVKGDRVGIFAHNGLDYLVAMLGAWRIGACAALVNVKFVDELDYYFADNQPKVVVYTHDMHGPVSEAASRVGTVSHLLCMDGPQEGALSLPELLAAGLPAPADPADPSAIAHLSYTSGTTGKPKGACLAHEPTVTAARCIAERLRISGADTIFGPTALSSSYVLVGGLIPALAHGATLEIMGRWTQPGGWEAIDRAGATALVGNPTLLEELLAESHARGRAPGQLRYALTGGGPMPPTLKRAWRDELRIPVVESYGQSELGGFVALGYPELVGDEALMRIGPPLPDKEVQIFGPDDRRLAIGEVGDIVLRGGFMAGYFGKPDKTAEATRDGWLRTGDIGFKDEDGHITLRSRRAELIEVAGETWYPRDVEEALCRQEGIRQAALIGVPAASGTCPTAFVTVRDGAAPRPEALKQAIAPELAYDLSRLEIRVVPELPMTPTGKISKGDLAALVAAGAA